MLLGIGSGVIIVMVGIIRLIVEDGICLIQLGFVLIIISPFGRVVDIYEQIED